MSMSSDLLLESIHDASPVTKVEAALNDDPLRAGIITEECPDAFVGSRLFNVATAAMDALRVEPVRPVIERPINIQEPEDWLGRFTLRILNDSIKRPQYRQNAQYESPYATKLGTCALVEEKFAEAADSIKDEGMADEPSLLFIDKGGRPVMFKKQSGEPSTLAFKPFQINGVRYPAGTLLNLEETADLPTESYQNLEIALVHKDHIQAIAPLRFSSFTFKPEARQHALEPITGYAIPIDAMSTFTTTALSDIINKLPGQATLRDIYAELRQE
jgi:hypothetical protein